MASSSFACAAANFMPAARRQEVVVETVEDELIAYDLRRHKAHALNPTAAQVWQWCDGATPVCTLVDWAGVQWNLNAAQAESLIWLSLERLYESHLLESPPVASSQPIAARREVLRLLGVAALLPVVYTLAAPSPAQAASCSGLGEKCRGGSGLPCCPGLVCGKGNQCQPA